MSEKTLKFNNIKKEFHKSKEPIDLMSLNVDQIVISDKFTHSDDLSVVTKKVKLLNHALSCLK